MGLTQRLGFKIALAVGIILLVSFTVFTFLVVDMQRDLLFDQMTREAEQFSTAVLNATHHSMLADEEDATARIVHRLADQEQIADIRIYNHDGIVKYAGDPAQIGKKVDKQANACYACHSSEKPFSEVNTSRRVRIRDSEDGPRVLGMIKPIYNRKSCYTAACHVHPKDQKVLGVIDVGMSLAQLDASSRKAVYEVVAWGLLTAIAVILTVSLYLAYRLNRPVSQLLTWIRAVARGDEISRIPINTHDELGELAREFNAMEARISRRTTELDRSRREYKTLFEQAPCLIAVVDKQFKVVRQNSRLKELFRGTTGMPCYRLFKRRDEKCEDCVVEKVMAEGQPYTREYCGMTKAGEDADYVSYAVPIVNDRGEIKYTMIFAVDLRDRKKLERELQVTQDFQTNLIENSIHAIVATDEYGRVNVFNRAAEQIYGYSAHEAVGETDLAKFFPPQFLKMIASAFREEPLRRRKLVAHETHIRSQSGDMVPVRFSGSLLFDENEKLVGAVGFCQDLTTYKKLEREKRDADRLAIVGQTVAGLAHGIKNVLQGLEGGMFVVQSAIEDQDQVLLDRGWDMISRNIDRVSALVRDLLSYSKERIPEFEPTDPNELAEEVCALFDLRAADKSIRLERDFDPAVESIPLDQRGLHTCLSNLVANAIDACEMDAAEKDHAVIVRTRLEDEWGVVFEVSDNGQGMDEETKAKIFAGFYSTKGSRGTGLGLLVTSKIVQEHGGIVSFESEPGVGTTFVIKLPEHADSQSVDRMETQDRNVEREIAVP